METGSLRDPERWVANIGPEVVVGRGAASGSVLARGRWAGADRDSRDWDEYRTREKKAGRDVFWSAKLSESRATPESKKFDGGVSDWSTALVVPRAHGRACVPIRMKNSKKRVRKSKSEIRRCNERKTMLNRTTKIFLVIYMGWRGWQRFYDFLNECVHRK